MCAEVGSQPHPYEQDRSPNTHCAVRLAQVRSCLAEMNSKRVKPRRCSWLPRLTLQKVFAALEAKTIIAKEGEI